jgi:hypothetical protein
MFEITHLRNAFLYRFTAINIFGFALLGAAFFQGWISQIYSGDTSNVTVIIAFTFLCAMVASVIKAIALNNLWNWLDDKNEWLMSKIKGASLEALGLRLSSTIEIIHHLAVILLLMGISGTMIGIIMALKSTEAFATSDQASMVVAILLLFKGVYVKFYASLVGIVFHGWILTNYYMLKTHSRRLLARMAGHV